MDSNIKSSGVSAGFSSKAIALGVRSKSAASTVAFVPVENFGNEPKSAKAQGGDIAEVSSDVALALSPQALTLALGSQAPAKTIDAGAPKGASKRLSAYGGAQSIQESKGAGFDASA